MKNVNDIKRKFVILVDSKDRAIGKEEKLVAHKKGKMHRAFSIFVINLKGEMLLQRRARNKYHSGGLWSNSCCGHPEPLRDTLVAAHKRLREEMGFDCVLEELFTFSYKADLDHGLREHEFDHVFLGFYDGEPILNKKEADDYKWVNVKKIDANMETNPSEYSFWFKIALDEFKKRKYFAQSNIFQGC